MPKISFVMPTKNRGNRIEKSIKSILNQTESDWELIITDDHSDAADNTLQVIEKINDQRIKYVRMPDDWSGGISCARNFGNIVATSPIIAIADSDDISKPHRAERTVKGFSEFGCDVYFGNYEVLIEATGEVKPNPNAIEKFEPEMLRQKNFISNNSSAYKRDLAYTYPYNNFFKVAEDYDFFSRIAAAGKKFHYDSEVLYTYVIHNSNASAGLGGNYFDWIVRLNRGWSDEDRNLAIKKILNHERE